MKSHSTTVDQVDPRQPCRRVEEGRLLHRLTSFPGKPAEVSPMVTIALSSTIFMG
jgi:hypothetical protein